MLVDSDVIWAIMGHFEPTGIDLHGVTLRYNKI